MCWRWQSTSLTCTSLSIALWRQDGNERGSKFRSLLISGLGLKVPAVLESSLCVLRLNQVIFCCEHQNAWIGWFVKFGLEWLIYYILLSPPSIIIQVDIPPGSTTWYHYNSNSTQYPENTDCSKYCTTPSDPTRSTQPSLSYTPINLRPGSIQSPIPTYPRAAQRCSHPQHPVQSALACQSPSNCTTAIPAISTSHNYLSMPSSLRYLPEIAYVWTLYSPMLAQASPWPNTCKPQCMWCVRSPLRYRLHSPTFPCLHCICTPTSKYVSPAVEWYYGYRTPGVPVAGTPIRTSPNTCSLCNVYPSASPTRHNHSIAPTRFSTTHRPHYPYTRPYIATTTKIFIIIATLIYGYANDCASSQVAKG